MGVYLFHDYQLDAAALELRCGTVRIALEPQVFALLLHLIEQRHRVVTKRELLDSIWRGADVTDSVIHRAMVKLRAALGDAERGASLLRTVHRVGYQFVGEVIDQGAAHGAISPGKSPAAAVVAQPGAPADRPPRVVVLPLDNLSGDLEWSWASWGVPRLAFEALNSERGISMVDMDQVQQALASLPADLATAARIGGLLGARWVIEGHLVEASPSSCTMRYVVHGGPPGTATLTADSSAGLAELLAQALRRLAGLPDGWAVTTLLRDPLVLQALERARDMGAHADWAAAARLLKVVLALEPGNTGARLRTLPYLDHASAVAEGESLLSEARRSGDQRLQAATHEALGRAHFRLRGPEWADFSERHFKQALTLAHPWAHEDWVVRIHLNLGYVFQLRREHEAALSQYEEAQRRMPQGNNAIYSVAALNNRAIIEAFQEQPLVAFDLAAQALSVCERHRLEQLGYTARATVSLAEFELGWLARATERSLANMRLLAVQQELQAENAAWALLVATHVGLMGHADPELYQVLVSARGMVGEASPRARVLLAATDALLPLLAGTRTGDRDRAIHDLLAVMADSESGGFREHTHHFAALAIELALRARSPGLLDRVRDALAPLPTVAGDLGLARSLRRAHAAQALWRGDEAAALEALEGARAGLPAGRVQALARLDLGWLLACRGQVEEAAAEIAGIRHWLDAMPQGLCLRARCLGLRGAWEGAADLQLEALRRRWPEQPAGWRAAFEAYAHGCLPSADDEPTLLTLR